MKAGTVSHGYITPIKTVVFCPKTAVQCHAPKTIHAVSFLAVLYLRMTYTRSKYTR